jgi:hypothetical protein
MSKRLQVLLDEKEFRDIQRIARQQQLTVANWVRQILRSALRQVPTGDHRKKSAILRAAVLHTFPTGDIDQMLQDNCSGIFLQSTFMIFVGSNIHSHV